MIDWDTLAIGPTMAVFGEPVVYTPAATGVAVPITGIFDAAYLPLQPLAGGRGRGPVVMGAQPNITVALPMLGVQLSQFPVAPKQGDALVVRGAPYTVREVQVDSHGGAKLLLNRGA